MANAEDLTRRLVLRNVEQGTDLERTLALAEGDACEFRYPARSEWLPGTVMCNGGAWYWSVRDESSAEARRGQVCRALYIEHVRAPGTNPWD